MKKLTKEEVARLAIPKGSGNFGARGSGNFGKNSKFYDAARELQVGEALIIKKTEWFGKTAPTTLMAKSVRFKYPTRRMSVLAMDDGKSWLVRRVK